MSTSSVFADSTRLGRAEKTPLPSFADDAPSTRGRVAEVFAYGLGRFPRRHVGSVDASDLLQEIVGELVPRMTVGPLAELRFDPPPLFSVLADDGPVLESSALGLGLAHAESGEGISSLATDIARTGANRVTPVALTGPASTSTRAIVLRSLTAKVPAGERKPESTYVASAQCRRCVTLPVRRSTRYVLTDAAMSLVGESAAPQGSFRNTGPGDRPIVRPLECFLGSPFDRPSTTGSVSPARLRARWRTTGPSTAAASLFSGLGLSFR
jgi:hypothetical protein